MRRSETIAAGWVFVQSVAGDPAADFHIVTISWRLGLNEIQVWGLREGTAVPVGDNTAFTYR